MRHQRPLVLVASLGFVSVAVMIGVSSAKSPTLGSSSPTPSPTPEPGDVVTVGLLGAVAPPPGDAVVAYASFPDGTGDRLVVQTLQDGTVVINPPDEEDPSPTVTPSPSEAAGSSSLGRGTGECNDNYVNTGGGSWLVSTVNWTFMASTTPTYLTVGAAEDRIRDGGVNIVQVVNNCGRPDNVGIGLNYQGRNNTHADVRVISGANVCYPNGRDFVNAVDFFDLVSAIAVTCNYDPGDGTLRYESEIRLNRDNYFWATGDPTCNLHPSAYYVEGLVTHERGHTFSVDDFPSGHPSQTMGGANGQCSGGADQKKNLGLGDMLSLESRY